ncbi:aminoglycoside phosphotransferase family protein [Pseudonocardiaceae bacterium YIM PH 21723]|nr:aminoglycoside phosphotransferase family protein [Pseudonocardiaceae bacterium YIM PH 21723]
MIEIGARLSPGGTHSTTFDRGETLLARVGDVVVKAHPTGTDPAALHRRLATTERLGDILLPYLPIDGAPILQREGRLITAWPAGTPVDPDEPALAPWEQAAELLAALHRSPVPADLPRPGDTARVGRALDALPDSPATPVIRAAASTLPDWARGGPITAAGPRRALVHGDWHLGQLITFPELGWRLIDIDDLGVGDPLWDLARPAALFAAGIHDPADWQRFLHRYASLNPVINPDDPWAELELPARALLVQYAATAVRHAHRELRELDEVEVAFVEACQRVFDGGRDRSDVKSA